MSRRQRARMPSSGVRDPHRNAVEQAPRRWREVWTRTPARYGALRREVKGVPEVEQEVAARAALALDLGVEARLAAAHVVDVAVRLRRALTVRLEHADEHEDLELAVERDVVPLLLRRAARDLCTKQPVSRVHRAARDPHCHAIEQMRRDI